MPLPPGYHHTDESRRKIGEANRRREYPPLSEEHRKKIGESLRGNVPWDKGKTWGHHTLEARRRISESKIGENNPSWRGGVSFEPYCVKFNREFKERVRAFFDHTCVECGVKQNGKKLHVHHVNFNKMACCDGAMPLFVALCHSCHNKTQFNRPYWEARFTVLISEQFGGQCYLLMEETRK